MDFRTYFRHYPDENGFFGPYGGCYVPEELQNALKRLHRLIKPSPTPRNSLTNCAAFAASSRGAPRPSTTASASAA